jgi:hypothetical protein
MKRIHNNIPFCLLVVLSAVSAGFAGTISMQVNYLGTSAQGLDRFNLSLISDNSNIVGAWQGGFSGSFNQIWTATGSDALPTTTSGSIWDTHYLLSPIIGSVSEDNDLSGDGLTTGLGTYLNGGAMIGNKTSLLPLAQIVVPADTSFTITGLAANGLGEKYKFDTTLTWNDESVQLITSEYIPIPVNNNSNTNSGTSSPTTPATPTTTPPTNTGDSTTTSNYPWANTYRDASGNIVYAPYQSSYSLVKNTEPQFFYCPSVTTQNSSSSLNWLALTDLLNFPNNRTYLIDSFSRPTDGSTVPEPLGLLLLLAGIPTLLSAAKRSRFFKVH